MNTQQTHGSQVADAIRIDPSTEGRVPAWQSK